MLYFLENCNNIAIFVFVLFRESDLKKDTRGIITRIQNKRDIFP